MSYDLVKSIVIKDDKVYLTSAANNVSPLRFDRWECETFSETLQKEGKEAVLARIGQNVWDGNFRLYKGSKLCNLFLQAREALPNGLNFSNTDGKAAGEYLARAVMKLEQNPEANLTEDVNKLLSLRNDKDYILEVAVRTGHNFLNFADVKLQTDRAFALEVLRAGGGAAWFEYPRQFAGDKEFALEALKLNGCFYRNLDLALQTDREVILEAFAEAEGKKYHEHLPDLIPKEAFKPEYTAHGFTYDKEFVVQLITCCPSLHIHRADWMLEDRAAALKWCEVGKWIPNDARYLPQRYAEEKEFQDILVSRCKEAKSYEMLEKRLAEKGITLPKRSLDDRIQQVRNNQVNKGFEKTSKELER